MRTALAFLAGTILLSSATAASATQRFLHVHIDEATADGSRVTLNLPIGLVEAALPLIPRGGEFHKGRVRINGANFDNGDLRAFWRALREAQDAPYATIEERDHSVRIQKADGFMIVEVTPHDDHGERAHLRVPLPVVDALFSGSTDELDLAGAVQALVESGMVGELVAVDDETTTVRIWIDDNSVSR